MKKTLKKSKGVTITSSREQLKTLKACRPISLIVRDSARISSTDKGNLKVNWQRKQEGLVIMKGLKTLLDRKTSNLKRISLI